MRLILALLLVIGWSGVAHAEDAEVPPDQRESIQQVIRQQIEAFRRDDGQAAFGLASPGIQAQFGGDSDGFMAMVRRGYQPVYRPRSTAFGAALVHEGQVMQRLEVVGPDGGNRTALYFMEHEADGTWRIGGCVLTESDNVGA